MLLGRGGPIAAKLNLRFFGQWRFEQSFKLKASDFPPEAKAESVVLSSDEDDSDVTIIEEGSDAKHLLEKRQIEPHSDRKQKRRQRAGYVSLCYYT